MFGKNIREKRVLAIIAVIIFVFGGVVTAYGVQDLGNAHSGALVSTVGINSDIGVVYGFNGTNANATYEVATLTTTANGTVTATFSDGFNATHIVAFSSNPKYDIQGILNKSLYYSTLNIKSSDGNLTSVSEVFGYQTNDTSMKNISDKAITTSNSYTSLNVYGNGVNHLGKTMAFSVFGLASANYNNMFGIVINLHNTNITKTVTNSTGVIVPSTAHLTITIEQSFGAPFNVNLIDVFADVFVVESIVAVGLVLLGMPKARGR